MKVFGKSLSEYVSFERGFLILILVVGLGRLCFSLAGAPASVVKFASMTVLMLLGLIYYSVRVHTSGFGSYKQLLPVLALQVILINLITIAGIVLAIETGKDNIFTVPEFSPGRVSGATDPRRHAPCCNGCAAVRSLGRWLTHHAGYQETDV